MAIFDPETKRFLCECGCGTELKDFMSTWAPGHTPRTEETRKKTSEALTGIVRSDEFCQHCSEANYRRYKEDPTLVDRIAEANRGWIRSTATCEKISKAKLKSYREDPTLTDRISKSKLGTYLGSPSESHSEALSEANRRTWGSMTYEEKARRLGPAWAAAAQHRKPNQAELLLDTWLQEAFPGEWKYVGNNGVKVGSRNPDFTNINGRKAVIELFGNYYHDPIYFPEKRTEEETLEDYRKYGFDCLIVWYGVPDDLILEWPIIVNWIKGLGRRQSDG